MWTGQFISALATFVFPFLALFLTARGFSPARAGLVASFYGVGIIVAGPLSGVSCDRLGRRPTILSALFGTAGSAAVLAFLASPVAIAAVVLLFGVSTAAVYTPIQATVADVVPEERRAHAFGLLYWANNVGVGVSLLLGGLLASRTWALPFLADAATSLLFALLVWRRLPETLPAVARRSADLCDVIATGRVDPPSGHGYGAVLRDGRFAVFLAIQVLLAIAFWQMQTSLPIDMARHGFRASAFGPVLAVNTGLIMLLQPFAARVTGRFAPTTVLSAASVLIGFGFGAYALCSRPWHYGVATGVWSLGEIGYIPIASALVTALAPTDLRGRYLGAYGLTFGTGSCLAAIVGPAVMQALGSPVLWVGCLADGMLVGAAYVVFATRFRRM